MHKKCDRMRRKVQFISPIKTFILIFLFAGIFFRPLPYAHATGGAYTSTKHGGGTVDGAPFNGVQRGVNTNPTEGYSTGIYNTVNPEAGQYQSGECAHCHEMHSSFGGTEPPPASGSTADPGGGPNTYLGMADTNPELCWYCHENISSTNPIGSGYYYFYQGKTKYQAAGHNTNLNMKSPGYGVSQPWPRTDRTTNLSAGHCLNCHTPHGIKGSAVSVYDNSATDLAERKGLSATKQGALTVPYLIPRQLISFEEALCENCHKTGGPLGALDIKTDILKLLTTGSGHPVQDTDQRGTYNGTTADFGGRHNLANEATPAQGWNSYSGMVDRHVECVDCHNPHTAQNATVFQQSGTAANPNRVAGPAGIYAGGTNKGVWGVSIDTATGAVGGRVEDTNPSTVNYSSLYLYQICLKCHSAFGDSTLTTQPAPSWSNLTRWPDSYFWTSQMNLTNVADDFKTTWTGDPYYAYHPVFASGRNQPPVNANPRWSCAQLGDPGCPWNVNDVPNRRSFGAGSEEVAGRATGVRDTTIGFANNFVPPWGPDSIITCVDCHESDAETNPRGPHGSSRPFILRKLDANITYTIPDDRFAGNGAGPYTVSYSNFDQGWQAGNAYGVSSVSLQIRDPNNLCLNCHRADVYGFIGQKTTAGPPQCGDIVFPRYRQLSRVPHPPDSLCMGMGGGFGYSFSTAAEVGGAGEPPRGIVCLRCHGGGTVGGIHGNNGMAGFTYGYTMSATLSVSSNRLINGAAWNGVIFSATYSSPPLNGSCVKSGASTINSCTNASGGSFDYFATYNY